MTPSLLLSSERPRLAPCSTVAADPPLRQPAVPPATLAVRWTKPESPVLRPAVQWARRAVDRAVEMGSRVAVRAAYLVTWVRVLTAQPGSRAAVRAHWKKRVVATRVVMPKAAVERCLVHPELRVATAPRCAALNPRSSACFVLPRRSLPTSPRPHQATESIWRGVFAEEALCWLSVFD